MIHRFIESALKTALDNNPAVALLGPRQVGKTTLALQISKSANGIYLDLESEADRAKISALQLFLEDHKDSLVILDEVHRIPGLFGELRGQIDKRRRQGLRNSQFLLLGSASLKLLKQSGETLAGRVSYLELSPLIPLEVESQSLDRLWVRGGFPDSFLAKSDDQSLAWRRDFTRTYLERDVPALGPRIPAETLRRLWVMLAHSQGGLLNLSQLGGSLDIDGKTVSRYIDLLVDLLLVRRLQPWSSNVGKRLVKTTKIYIRDSGIVHSLLGLGTKDQLLAHPVVGHSWEGFALEGILSSIPQHCSSYFYRTAAGAEIDLVIDGLYSHLVAIEIKLSLDPRPEKGFYIGMADLGIEQGFIVYPGESQFRINEHVLAIPLRDFCKRVSTTAQ